MDFLITELFEALSRGHYIWKCGVCGKYFLMTTAHNQLYCSTVNEEYGVPCTNIARNRRKVKLEYKPESRKDTPQYILRKKRLNSVRKNKSLGKYSDAVSAEAKKIIDRNYERAQFDFDYSEKEYEADMNLKKIYEEAIKNVDARI